MSEFAPLKLHVVIADDDEGDRHRIRTVFEKELESWGMAREKQFEFHFHECPTVEDFKETAKPLVKAGDLV